MAAVVFTVMMVLGLLSGIALLRLDHLPTPDPYDVFVWVERGQRAEYVRQMRGTMAVQFRDLSRAMHIAVGKTARALRLGR